MKSSILIPEYSRLKKAQEDALETYTGARHQLFDGNGNMIQETDTRTPNGQLLRARKDLKIMIATKYAEEFPQFKVDQARANTLDDPTEKDDILAKDVIFKREYQLRKAKAIEAKNAGDLDLMEEVALSDAWTVVHYPDWVTLGLSGEYILEKTEV